MAAYFGRLSSVFLSLIGVIFASYLVGSYLFFLNLIILGARFIAYSSFLGYYILFSSFFGTSLATSGLGLSTLVYSSILSLFFLKAKGFFFY